MPKLILLATLGLSALLSGCGTNYGQMIEYASMGLQNNPTQESKASLLTIRAEALRAKGQYEAALKDHHEAVALDPELPGHLQARGLTYQAMGRQQEAQADFDKVPALDEAWQAKQAKLQAELRPVASESLQADEALKAEN